MNDETNCCVMRIENVAGKRTWRPAPPLVPMPYADAVVVMFGLQAQYPQGEFAIVAEVARTVSEQSITLERVPPAPLKFERRRAVR